MSADLPTLGKPITTALTGRGFRPLFLRLALISALASMAAFFTCSVQDTAQHWQFLQAVAAAPTGHRLTWSGTDFCACFCRCLLTIRCLYADVLLNAMQ